jgi:ABC-type transport system involved in multi-copper enzyme maturation permease subunit
MPISESRYRRIGSHRSRRLLASIPVAALCVRLIARRTAFVPVLGLSLAPTLLAGAGLMITLPSVSNMPRISGMFAFFAEVQAFCAFFVTAWIGAGLVGDDFRTGALAIYFSRPLARFDYLLGKFAVLFAFNFTLLAAPGVALLALTAGLDGAGIVRHELGSLLLPVVAVAALTALTFTCLALAAGGIARHGSRGAALFVAFLVLPELAASVMPEEAQVPLEALVVRRLLLVLERALFHLPPLSGSMPWTNAAGCLLLIVAGAVLLLVWRLSVAEVIR